MLKINIPQRLKRISPSRALILSYLFFILIGTLAFCSRYTTADGLGLSFIDALFMSTSAMCVTGLVVVDPGTHFNLAGQILALILIQFGGIGIMTFSIYLYLYIKRNISIYGRLIIQETLMHTPISSWKELIRRIIKMTFIIESAGAVLMSFVFIPQMGFWKGLYYSIFHAISSFCNAGISLFSNSFELYRGNLILNFTSAALIILGGIGFLVINEILEIKLFKKHGRIRISLHSKIVIYTSIFLIVSGTALIMVLEYSNSMVAFSIKDKILTSFFQSVTTRTAGFNTIDISSFKSATILLLIFLMFIGASPGSAGGGVKTTALAVFAAIIYNRFKGNSNVNIFHRTIAHDTITRALTIALIVMVVSCISLFLLLIFQPADVINREHGDFLNYLFETISAISTVGLSIGATPELGTPGKFIITVLMFIGRIGLLTVAYSIAGGRKYTAPRFAEENLMVGQNIRKCK